VNSLHGRQSQQFQTFDTGQVTLFQPSKSGTPKSQGDDPVTRVLEKRDRSYRRCTWLTGETHPTALPPAQTLTSDAPRLPSQKQTIEDLQTLLANFPHKGIEKNHLIFKLLCNNYYSHYKKYLPTVLFFSYGMGCAHKSPDMKIASVTLKGFRCFGLTPNTIRLSEGITALVGANGTGKTALLEALLRVLGITRDQRTVRRTDFYVPPGTSTDDRSERQLFIDIRLIFPELEEDSRSSDTAIPSLFRHLQVEEPNEKPFVRLRLEAKWRDDRTVDGEIEQKLCWVTTSSGSPSSDEMRHCEPDERGLIQVHYVPASRDPSTQLTYATTAMAGRLLRVIAWSSETQQAVQGASQQIREAFGKELVIQAFNQTLTQRWGDLHDDLIDAEPEFNIASKQFEEEIRRVCVVFRPTELGDQRELDSLSDGQKSLFYFSLVAAVFDIERKLVQQRTANNPNELDTHEEAQEAEIEQNIKAISTDDQAASIGTNFYSERLRSPALTIFALEEPENHLAPYFLTRIIQQVRSLVDLQSAQALLTSHSSAVLGRIRPSEVRHFRLNSTSRCASINEIKLPHISEEAAKYVREAVNVYPELYFARFVILGEGDSEQVVLPRLASAMGLEVDRSFVAIVPLGGRHVNHFWKLLYDLDIPHVTLLDLDKGRQGAGWGRIKYTCKQLLAVGVKTDELLSFVDSGGNKIVISEEELEKLHIRNEQDEEMNAWICHLEKFNVFFSEPLDLDMAMLSNFPGIYKSVIPVDSGPRVPSMNDANYQNYLDAAGKAVLGDGASLSNYSNEIKQLFPWYRYLFLQKSKPSTHLQALSLIENSDLASDAPQVLFRLLKAVDQKLYSNKK